MQQLSFSFHKDNSNNLYSSDNFIILPENSEAFKILENFFKQPNFSSATLTSLLIKGQSKSGKSHLLHIFAQKYAAQFIDSSNLENINWPDFFETNKFYIFKNLNQITNQELILAIINSANEANAFLAMSSESDINFTLKDLSSRFRNIFSVEIENPSLQSIKMLLTNYFARKQIKLSRQVIDFLSNNIERSYRAIFDIVKLVELRLEQSPDAAKISEIRKIF